MHLGWLVLVSLFAKHQTTLQDDPPVTCPIPIVKNGYVINNNNEELGVGDRLEVECGLDYELSSTDEVLCQDDGTYSKAVPTCDPKDCPSPEIDNGKINPAVESITPSQSVDVVCNDGYVLSTVSPTITCETNKIFKPFNLPTCRAQNCNSDTVVPNGKITGPTPYISPGMKLLIQCDQGYQEQDQDITCVTLNTFNPSGALGSVCQAQNCVIPTITHSTLRNTEGDTLAPGEKIVPGDTFTVACDDQYVRSGDTAVVACVTLNEFNPTAPTCQAQPCPELQIDFGEVSGANPGQPYSITCNDNYQLATTVEFLCVSGSITSPNEGFPPTCAPKDCPLDPIENGEISGTLPLSPGSTATLSCADDYLLVGNPSIECVAGTTFKEDLPKCQANPCTAPTIGDGSITNYNPGSMIPAGATFTIKCNEPYDLSSPGDIICVTKNIFNPSVLPTCQRGLCNEPDIANGQVTGPSIITPESILTIQCDTGFKMSHNDDVVCYSMDKFNPDPPTCEGQPCPKPPDSYITNGGFIEGQAEQVDPGQTFTMACNTNYNLVGSATVTCKSGSVFEEDFPKCTAMPCPKSAFTIENGEIVNGGTEIPVNARIEIQCNTDYQLTGTAVLCKAGSETSGELQTCIGQDCTVDLLNKAHGIENGEYTKDFTSGELIVVTCSNGFELVEGDAVCDTKSRVKGTLPVCNAVNCNFDPITNGNVKNSDTITPGDRIEVECDEGYELSDKTTIYKCKSATIYEPPSLPACDAVPCPVPEIPNGSVLNPDTPIPVGATITVSCTLNYLLVGPNDITCLSGSTLSGDLPVCTATPCTPLPDIANGRVENGGSEVVVVGGDVRVVCDTHFKLTPDVVPKCVTNTVYQPNLPVCIDKDCAIPAVSNGKVTGYPDGAVTVSKDTTLTVTCNSGYDLDTTLDGGVVDNSGSITCVRNTVFSPALPTLPALICNPQPCPVNEPPIANANIYPTDEDYVDPGVTVSIQCHSKYKLSSGDGNANCVAHTTYEPPRPSCVAKDCPAPTISHGSAGSQDVAPQEQLLVNCDQGYDLSTTLTVRCVAWDLFSWDDGATSTTDVPACLARPCSKDLIPAIKNGKISNQDQLIQPGSPIEVDCAEGYKETPSAGDVTCVTRLSDTKNKYSSDLPSCVAQACPVPSIPNTLTSTVTEVSPGHEVVYTCKPGFSSNDTSPLYCVTDKQYSLEYLPACIQNCNKDDAKIPNGYISGPGTLTTGGEIFVTCNPGFVRVNSAEVVRCVTGDPNTYDPAEPAGCKAVPCPIPTIDRAIIDNTGTTVPVGDPLQVSCPEVYQLVPAREVKCVSGSLYSPEITGVKCVEKVCVLSADSIENGLVSEPLSLQLAGEIQYEYNPGDRLQFACNTGYSPSRASSWCVTHTVWAPPLPLCQPVPCTTPTIPYAAISPWVLDPGTVLTMSCSLGKVPSYIPETDNLPTPSFHCVTDNQFSLQPLPTCQDRACQVPVIPHSNYDGSQFLEPGAELAVSCDGNYNLEMPAGVTRITCRSTNYWSNSWGPGSTQFPRCAAKNCVKPVIDNGIVSTLDTITPGSTLSLACGMGYVTPAINTFKCVSYEIFNPSDLPQCGTTNCIIPTDFAHGFIKTPLKPGADVIITCDDGYAEDCEETFSCVTGTIFLPNSILPECKPRKCVKPGISGGKITNDEDTIAPGSYLTIQCDASKAITSHILPRCVHTTLFEPPVSDMECVPATNCTRTDFSQITGGELTSHNVAPGQYTTLKCQTGYTPVPADRKVYCVVGGINNPIYPVTYGCLMEKCVIPSVAHGRVTQDLLPVNTQVDIRCDTGYYSPYQGKVMCLQDGSVSHDALACKLCDSTMRVTSAGTLSSPLYGSSDTYPANLRCTYTLLADNTDNHIRVTLSNLDIETSTDCSKDSLSFYDGDSVSNLIFSTCGSGITKRAAPDPARAKRAAETSARVIESSGRTMTVVFVSDGAGGGAGFSFQYGATQAGGSNATIIAVAVVVPLILILVIVVLLVLYCRYWRAADEPYEPHKNFHWKEGGGVDNSYFHFIANGGRKPPNDISNRLQVTAQLPEDETDSVISSTSRSKLTPARSMAMSNAMSYSSLKLGLTPSNITSPQSRHSSRIPAASPTARPASSTGRPASSTRVPLTPSHRTSPNSRPGFSPSSHLSSNLHSRELENMEKYNHKQALEGLGLSEADFKLNIPTSYRSNLSESMTESQDSLPRAGLDDSFTRTALEDTLLDGDPLQHTTLSEDVLRSPQTMRALDKFRAGARKEMFDDPNDENYEMKKQNRIRSEELLEAQRRAYNAGFRRPLPKNSDL